MMFFSRKNASNSPGWMITLADLLSLLVSFFALLYATTATDPAKWNQVVKPISAYLTGVPVASSTTEGASLLSGTSEQNYTASILSRLMESDAAFSGTEVTVDDHAIRVIMRARPDLSGWMDGTPSPLAGLARTLGSLHLPIELIVYRQSGPDETTSADFVNALRDANKAARHLKDAGLEKTIHPIGMIEPGSGGNSRLEISIPSLPSGSADLPNDRTDARIAR